MSHDDVIKKYNSQPKTYITKIIIYFIILLLILASSRVVLFKGISKHGLIIARNIILGLLNPSPSQFNLASSGVPYLLLQTFCIGFLGTFIGTLISVPFAFLAARNMTNKTINIIGIIIITFIRTFPAIVLGLMFIRVTGPGPFAGVLTLALTSVGMVSKLFIEAIEDLDKGVIEALDASGADTFRKIRFGIIPQLFTNFVSIALYRFEINIKDATILGIVGAGGIGAPLLFAMNESRWRDVGAILFGLILMVLVVEYFSTKIRKFLATGVGGFLTPKMYKTIRDVFK